MYTGRNSVQKINWIVPILVVSLGVLSCNVLTRFTEPEIGSPSQPVTVETESTTSQNDGQAEIPDFGGTKVTYDGDYNGIKYQLDLPGGFIHSTSGGWQEFCLDTTKNLCVSIQPQNGTWNDSEAMADEVITGFSRTVGNYQELNRQSTTSGDGFPAFWIAYTYTWQDKNLEGSRLFIVLQHVGFDIAAVGDPALMEKYRSEIKSIIDSFSINYN